jgi:pSer/pThr/pTyr-binding forkhead associated (FHA) protein
MPVIRVNDKPYALKPGQTRLGSGPDADIGVPGDDPPGVQAVLTLEANSGTIIRRARDGSAVKVNGVPLGAEPTPLMHGDKVEIGGVELLFSDDKKGGATEFVSTADVAAIAASKRAGSARATTATGGRLVSLVDGKEYTIPDDGVVIGRDASCAVVVAQSEVSRHHARISPAQNGYLLVDQSTNGVYVNGERIQGSQVLSRSDVIRIGSEEFRFYADMAPIARPGLSAPAAASPAASPVQAPAAPPRRAPAPLSTEPATLPPPGPLPGAGPAPAPPKPAAAPVASPASAVPRPVIGTLEMRNEGPDKGKVFELRDPLVHVGRGAHNDVSLAEESVSDSHAKLQRRDDGWYVVDMGSTNGTYAGGKRVEGERKLAGAPDLRFGGVKMTFRPVAEAGDAAKGTRAFVTPAAARPAPEPQEGGLGARIPSWVWVVAALLVVGAIVYTLTG